MKKATDFIFNDKLFTIVIISFISLVIFLIVRINSLTSEFEKQVNEVIQKQKILIIDDYGNTYLTTLIEEKPTFLQKFALDMFYRMFYLNKDYIKINLKTVFNFMEKESAKTYQKTIKKLIDEINFINSIYKPEIEYFLYKKNTVYIIFKYNYFAQNKTLILPDYYLVKFKIVDGKVNDTNNIGLYIQNLKIYKFETKGKKVKLYQLINKVKGL